MWTHRTVRKLSLQLYTRHLLCTRLWAVFYIYFFIYSSQNPKGSPCSSVGKESTYNAGDPSSNPGLGRSTGERIGYPLQHSWASLVAQLVKNSTATQETWIQSLVWEDSLEKGKATLSSILTWRIPWTIWSMGLQRVGHD